MACGQLRTGPDRDEARQSEIDEALAAVGLVATAPVERDEVFALWPENVPTFNFWQAVQTQWSAAGTGYPTGLDYAGVAACMDLHGIRKAARAELFVGLQVMEQATLTAWSKQKK